MGKIYLLHTLYEPNTAPTNRVLSFLKSFSDLRVDVEMVYVLPDKNFSKYPTNLPCVTFRYLWGNKRLKNPYIKQIYYSFYVWKFVRSLHDGDIVILMDMARAIFPLIKKRGIRVFHEKTEHPYAYKVRTINVEKYINACKCLDGLFVISNPLKQYFISRGVNPDKVHIINMTVDGSRFENISKIVQDTPYIAYCGTASRSKDGVDELIKAFALFNKIHPKYKLYIIGKVPTHSEDMENIRLIERLGVKDNVVLTGVIPSSEMPQLLKNAEILALDRPDSLQAQNGFPTKLGEYLLSENPVVVTKVGDIPRFLENEESAMLANERDEIDFSNKLCWLAEHPEEAKLIGARGASIAKKYFNAKSETQKILNIIKR